MAKFPFPVLQKDGKITGTTSPSAPTRKVKPPHSRKEGAPLSDPPEPASLEATDNRETFGPEDLPGLTVAHLRDLAYRWGLTVPKSARKARIIKILRDNWGGAD